MDILKTLLDLNTYHGPAGNERDIAAGLERLCVPFADETAVDTMGNLIVRKKGGGPRVMLAAHMDSAGFIVTHVEKEGFLRISPLGSLSMESVLHTPVRFQNGVKGLVCRSASTSRHEAGWDDFYLDIGAKDARQAEQMVRIGDAAVFSSPAAAAGERLISPYLGGRLACVALLSVLERLGKTENDLYFVFTAQGELGQRGAGTAAYAVAPDYALAVDVTPAGDEPGRPGKSGVFCGGGAAVKVMDRTVISHPQMIKKLETLARERGIPFQRDVAKSAGTDAGPIHASRGGVPSGGVGIPCRYLHSPVEMADGNDVEACVRLLLAFAESKLSEEV